MKNLLFTEKVLTLRTKTRMKDIKLKQISINDVYRPVVTRQRVTNADGWTRMELVERQIAPTGSLLVDAVAQALDTGEYFTGKELARAMQTNTTVLNGVFQLYTDMDLHQFMQQFRLKRACDWLAHTDLDVYEVATRSGFATQPSFTRQFLKQLKCSPTDYRKRNRPADFRERYEWE